MTEIREPNYTIDLPGEWERAESLEEGAVVYRDTNGKDTLRVLLLGVKPVFSMAEPLRLLTDYMEHRRQYENARGETVQSEPTSAEVDGRPQGGWEAFDPPSGRMMRHKVVVAGTLLADIRYTALDLDPAAFDIRAGEILSTVTVTPPA